MTGGARFLSLKVWVRSVSRTHCAADAAAQGDAPDLRQTGTCQSSGEPWAKAARSRKNRCWVRVTDVTAPSFLVSIRISGTPGWSIKVGIILSMGLPEALAWAFQK